MPVDLQGFAELQGDLSAMAAALSNGSGVDRALRAGAEPIHQQMLRNASTDPKIITGALHGSIKVDNPRSRGGGKSISIGVKYSEMAAYYSNPVEVGHGGPAPAPAHPFVKPAFDARAEEAYGEIRNVLAQEIMRRG